MATHYKLLFIFGTRPEAIKRAPVVKEAARDPAFRVEICATAQHRELLDQMLQVFEIAPGYDLDLMDEAFPGSRDGARWARGRLVNDPP